MNIPIHELIGNPSDEDSPVEVSKDQLERADLAQLNCDLALTAYTGVIAIIRRKKDAIIATVEIMVSALGWPVANNGRDEIFASAIGASIGQLAAGGAPVDYAGQFETDADTGFTVTIPTMTGSIVADVVRHRIGEVIGRAKALMTLAQGGPELVNLV